MNYHIKESNSTKEIEIDFDFYLSKDIFEHITNTKIQQDNVEIINKELIKQLVDIKIYEYKDIIIQKLKEIIFERFIKNNYENLTIDSIQYVGLEECSYLNIKKAILLFIENLSLFERSKVFKKKRRELILQEVINELQQYPHNIKFKIIIKNNIYK